MEREKKGKDRVLIRCIERHKDLECRKEKGTSVRLQRGLQTLG